MADVTATPDTLQPQSSPNTAQLTPPAPMPAPAMTQSPQQPTPVAVPAAPGKTFHDLSHALMGGILGSLAGQPPTTYTTDPSGKTTPVQTPSTQETTGDKLRRIAQAALLGLAAGSRVPQQKSGMAAGLAGLGAGAEAQYQRTQDTDLLRRKQASDEFEQQQKAMLQKHEIARNNALTLSTYLANKKMANDMTPEFGLNESLMKSAEDSPELANHVTRVTDTQIAAMQKQDPNFLATHIVRPLGWAPMVDQEGNPVTGPDGEPKSYMRMGVIDGTREGQMAISPELAQNIKEYGSLASIPGLDQIQPGQTYPLEKLLPLINAVDEQKKNVLQGWQKSTIGWTPDEKGNLTTPVEINAYDKTRSRPFGGGVVPAAAVEEKQKERVQGAQADELEGASKEHLANAASVMGVVNLNKSLANNPAFQAQMNDAISKLPPKAQTIARSIPFESLNSLLKMANGDAKVKDVFPSRNYKLAGGLTEQQAINLMPIFNSDWNEYYADNKADALKEVTSGKEAQQIRSFNQFFVHSADALQISNDLQRTVSPLLNEPINWISKNAMGQPGIPELMTGLTAARTEWTNMLAAGYAPTADEKKNGDILLSDTENLGQVANVLRIMGKQGIGRIDQVNEGFKSVWGSDIPNLITPSGRAAIEKLGLGPEIQGKYQTGGMMPGAMPGMQPSTVQQPGQPAAVPNQSGPSPQSGQVFPGVTDVRQGPNGHQIGILNNQWVDAKTGQPLPPAPVQGQ